MAIFKKGAQWRKWDLHIHTPGTKRASKFDGKTLEEKWDKYIEDINKSPVDISVIGITDYFCMENYFIFKDKIADGSITKPFDFVIPNVELRMSPVTGESKPINIHCLFNPKIEKEIEERFFSNLVFRYKDSSYNATKESFIRLGRALSQGEINNEGAEKKGRSQYVISFDNLQRVFDNDKDLRENTIIVVANGNDGVSGLRNHADFFDKDNPTQLDGLVNSIYQFSDALFSSSKGDRNYFTGHNPKFDEDTIRQRHLTLMPCFHGCDAHENAKIFMPTHDRYCWIKADPTFTGLRQTLFEPLERVVIQPDIPEAKTGYQVIDKIGFNHPLIGNKEIDLNPGLNCIIGGRSTGKSVLLSALAKRLQTTAPIKKYKEGYDKLITDISNTMEVIWEDRIVDDEREIEFFHQGYMYEYSRSSKKFDKLVKSILEGKENGGLFEHFENFKRVNETVITGLIRDLFGLKETVAAKQKEKDDIGDLVGIDKETEKLQGLISETQKKTGLSVTEYENFQKLKKLKSENEEKSISLDIQDNHLQNLINFNLFNNLDISPQISDEIKNNVNDLHNKLAEQYTAAWKTGLNEIISNIRSQSAKLKTQNEKIQISDIFKKGLQSLTESQTLKQLEDRLSKEMSKKARIERIEKELENLNNNSEEKKNKILEKQKKFHQAANLVAQKLTTVYKDLEIKASAQFQQKNYTDLLIQGINLQSQDRKNKANFNYKESGGLPAFEKEIEEKFDSLFKNEIVLVKGQTSKSMMNRILSESYFEVSYEIVYDGDKYSEMSEGKQAFIVLKLLLDFSDKKCPILIDQPEDDLDNRAIFNDLVKYLKAKKKERQIIIVTHNPNIVVGTDAELVAIANQHGVNNMNDKGFKFQYLTGSIENTSVLDKKIPTVLERQGVREHICEILEGGERAFKQREKRYDIKNM